MFKKLVFYDWEVNEEIVVCYRFSWKLHGTSLFTYSFQVISCLYKERNDFLAILY